MNTLSFIIIAILGTVIGSFLNVVICRFNTGRKIGNSRSVCFSCNTTLKWYELIPLVSFFIQIGKCRTCKSPISFQYPFVEILTAIIFALTAFKISHIFAYPNNYFILATTLISFVFCLWIVMFVYDIRHKIIPDIFSYSAFFVTVFTLGLFYGPNIIANVLLGAFVTALPFALFFFISKGKWMGFGDAKIALSIGALLGISGGLTAFILSFWIGAIFSVGLIILKKTKWGLKTEIPFAPFLFISAWLVFFLGLDFYSLINIFRF